MRVRSFYIILLFSLFSFKTYAQTPINNFIIKENLLKNEKIAIIAADSVDKPIEGTNGTFLFSINGFKQELQFHDGIAIAPQQIEKSTFVYIKHTNENGTYAKLYYVIKKGVDLNPIKINWALLAIIPIALIILSGMFRKFILYAVVILAAMFFFNHSQGLSIPTFFETVFDGLKASF